MFKQIEVRFCVSLSILANFYILCIICTKLMGMIFCAAHESYSYFNCKKQKHNDFFSKISKSREIGFNASIDLTGTKADIWPVDCG